MWKMIFDASPHQYMIDLNGVMEIYANIAGYKINQEESIIRATDLVLKQSISQINKVKQRKKMLNTDRKVNA